MIVLPPLLKLQPLNRRCDTANPLAAPSQQGAGLLVVQLSSGWHVEVTSRYTVLAPDHV